MHILGFALFIFWLLLIARVVVEFIRSFSRDWHPRGLTVVVLEIIMTVTDPPVKLLRRLIPQLTIGAVRFDLSIMVLLLVAFIGMTWRWTTARDAAGRFRGVRRPGLLSRFPASRKTPTLPPLNL